MSISFPVGVTCLKFGMQTRLRFPPNNQHSFGFNPQKTIAGKRALRIFSIMLMYVDVTSTNGVFSHKNTSYKQQKEKVRIPGQKVRIPDGIVWKCRKKTTASSSISETSRNGIIKSLTSPEKVRGTMQKRTTLNKLVPQWAIHRVQLVQIISNNSNFTMVD